MKNPCGANRRVFPRYRISADCIVMVSGKSLNAVLTDFSLSGAGVFIKDLHSFQSPIIEIKAGSLELDSQAKIIWRQDLFSGMRLGLHRIGHGAGTLSHYRFADILLGVKKSGRTGVLHVDHGNAARKVFFKQGDVIFASSNLEEERMGDILLDIGKISRAQFDESVEMMAKTGKRQGTVLVELGHLNPAELIWAVQYQVEKIVHNLFSAGSGRFVFRDEPLPLNEVITFQLGTGSLIYRGSKSVKNDDIIIRTLPALDAVLCVSLDSMDSTLQGFLDENDRKILSLIGGDVTLQDILSLSPLPEQETLRILFALMNARVIDIDEKETPPAQEYTAEAPAEEEEDAQEAAPEFVEQLDKLHAQLKELDYYRILGVSRGASAEEVKKAYHKLVREYHPDRHAYIRSEGLRQKLNAVFAFVNEAYRNLSSALNGKTVTAPKQQEPEAVDNQELAKIRFREGILSFKKSKYDQAMTMFGQAVYLDNAVPDYHYYYGRTLLMQKKIKDAEESIKKAVHLSPRNADYIAELGHIYLQLGFKTRAKNTFEKALQYNPRHERASDGLSRLTT